MALGLRGSKGVAAPPFTAGPYEWDQFVTFSAGIGASVTPGHVFYVDPRGPEYGLGNDANDGKSWSHALATIQAAVDKCVDKRGDVIFVGPAANAKNSDNTDYRKIKENVLITKSNVHIYAVPFKSTWSHQYRPSDGSGPGGDRTEYAISLYPPAVVASNVGFVVNAQCVEIAGFCIDVGGGMVGIYIGDGSGITGTASESYNSAGAWIHDNYIRGGSEGTAAAGIVLQGCGSDVIIENNTIEQCGGYGIYIGSGSGKTNERPKIINNRFIDNKGYGVYVYNSATNRQILIHGNVFTDETNTMTAGIKSAGTSTSHMLVSGNFFGCDVPLDLSTSDFFSGNFKVTTGTATETYIAEA
uniref:Putative pectate lyase n=1 Tax=viral metagenome TaxID=1070528 RepID=A0A6M3XUI6_9ZZZZ